MSEILDGLITECSNINGRKHKIEKIMTEEKKSIEMLPEENKEERIKGIIKYAREKVSVWKSKELNTHKYLLLKRSKCEIDRLYRKLADEICSIENTIQEIEKCTDYNEILLLRDKIRGNP